MSSFFRCLLADVDFRNENSTSDSSHLKTWITKSSDSTLSLWLFSIVFNFFQFLFVIQEFSRLKRSVLVCFVLFLYFVKIVTPRFSRIWFDCFKNCRTLQNCKLQNEYIFGPWNSISYLFSVAIWQFFDWTHCWSKSFLLVRLWFNEKRFEKSSIVIYTLRNAYLTYFLMSWM